MLVTELKSLIADQVEKGFRDNLNLGKAFKESDIYKQWAEMSKIKPNKLLSGEDTKQFNTGSGKSYKALYGISKDTELSNGGFDSLNDFLMAVNNRGVAPDRRLSKDLEEGVGSAGGFLLPELFEESLMNLNLSEEIIRPRCKVYGIPRAKGNSISIPAYADTTHATGIAGVRAYWTAEKGALTESTPTLRKIFMSAEKLTCLCDSSNELIEDSAIPISEMIGYLFKAVIGYKFDEVSIGGTGAGQPLGFRNSPAVITVAKEDSQDADTIIYENLVNMFSRLPVNSYLKKNTIWISSVSNIPQLMQIGIKLGTAGVHIPVFKEETGKYYMLGKECLFSEHASLLGEEGNLMLVDLSQYALAIKAGIRIESSIHDKFTTDMSTFRAVIRFDGTPLINSALTLADGSTTVSPYIQLGIV
ncbi:phage major capsid protein [Candidatus Atribacteria bacterium 1244-E10-H5-B2]|nr:MAG: phage major capsid protein [Candidatus Atribacteria bacterium 1244-E10-H5-B2]